MSESILEWQPYMPLWALIGLGIAMALVYLWFARATRRFYPFRVLFAILLFVLLCNPVWRTESGEATETVITVAVDASDSQEVAGRADAVQQISESLVSKLEGLDNVRVETLRIDGTSVNGQTDIFGALQDKLLAHNPNKVGGAVIITDGQIGDVPENADLWSRFGPVHTVMTGEPKDEWDRRIRIDSAPSYAVVGESVPIKFTVVEEPNDRGEPIEVTVRGYEDTVGQKFRTMPGQPMTVRYPIDSPGENLIIVSVGDEADELSAINNTQVLTVEGVRDRLKVLLVSGQPYQGLRIWRNLLKSDPAVDLVHFTILRARTNIDITPTRDLALIPFPTNELFEEKIDEFDLIILDRYTRRSILTPNYFNNIRNFVKEGGALLAVHGPEEVTGATLADSALKNIFPSLAIPNSIENQAYQPVVSDFGLNHPIIEPLALLENRWGAWQRYLPVRNINEDADVLLETEDGAPLLLIHEVGEGRVAQFTSDQIWYWARGFDGGGPYADLMRRLSHWLMKEPSLEYQRFRITETPQGLVITAQESRQKNHVVTVTRPDLGTDIVTLDEDRGMHRGFYSPELPGLYTFVYNDDASTERAFVYRSTALDEYNLLISAPNNLEDIVKATDAALIRKSNALSVDVGLTSDEDYSARNTMLFRQSRALENRTVDYTPVLPFYVMLLLGFALSIAGWLRRE